jgi:hypothetical protein
MTHEPAHQQKPFDPADYPALQEFFPAYLHQDFAEEYDSAAEAVKGFLEDASGDEILKVKEEWAAFRDLTRGRTLEETEAALGKMGSAWRPLDERELKEFDEILSHAEA